ncbi:MAG: radical SAM protein, partial [Clostridiales Family XIII bacterium]|nr:radical SAM protein [Clostridiales Family XIII bacterium]
MQYRLNERLALRGWDDHPFALQDLKAGSVSFLDEAAFRALSFCNGVMDVDSPLIPDMYRAAIGAFAARKAVEPCEAKRPLSPEQRLRVFPTRFVANVYWSITGRCNMRCRHCFMSAPQAKYGEMSHDKCMDIIRQMGGLGVPSVWLSGGEPLVREDFLELVDALTEQGINIARIYTNGLLVDEALLDELDGRGVHPDFFLSFDGVGWHDWLRGVEGAEQMAIDR